MRVVFLGTGEFGVPALRALRQAGHELVAAISQPDRPTGRGREVRPTPLHAAADELGVRHIQTVDVNALESAALGAAEMGVVAAFGQKIGSGLLGALPRGLINLHGSLLPKYRGAAPIQRAILDGEEIAGVTIFRLNERWDAGAIWATRATPIGATETADELHDRLAVLAAELLIEALAALEGGTLRPVEQDATHATRALKLTKADGYVDWSQPAERVVRRIHGLWSWPAAACTFSSRSGKRERVLLARATVAEADAAPTDRRPPGSFGEDLTVQAGRGRVRLLELRPASGKLMLFAAFAHGRHVAPPDCFMPAET
jgi:methionyl-tRNA formyltransferase